MRACEEALSCSGRVEWVGRVGVAGGAVGGKFVARFAFGITTRAESTVDIFSVFAGANTGHGGGEIGGRTPWDHSARFADGWGADACLAVGRAFEAVSAVGDLVKRAA